MYDLWVAFMKIRLNCSSAAFVEERVLEIEFSEKQLIEAVGEVNRELRKLFEAHNRQKRADKQTHCRFGHEYTEDSSGVSKRGCRYCKVCSNERVLRWKIRKSGK